MSSSDKENDLRDESLTDSTNDDSIISDKGISSSEENGSDVSILIESDDNSKNKPQNSRKKKATRNTVVWIKIESFDSYDEAHKFLVDSGYSHDCTKEPSDGKKEYYRCKAVPKKNGTCPAKKMLFLPNTSTECQIFAAKCDHDHSFVPNDAKKRLNISKEMETEIAVLYHAHMKPSQIINYLKTQQKEKNKYVGEQVPSKSQL